MRCECLECICMYVREKVYAQFCAMTDILTRSIIILVAGTIGCHGFLAVKERLWMSFQHCAILTSQTELENNITNISSTVVKIYKNFGSLEALLSLLILCERHRVFSLLSCFFTRSCSGIFCNEAFTVLYLNIHSYKHSSLS